MTGVAISALPAATTPLAGTELAAIVQSGHTKKATVADFTVGAVSGTAGGVAFFNTNTSVTTANPVTNFTWDDGLQILTVPGTIVLGTSSANQASTLLLDSAHQIAWDNGSGGVSFVFKDNGDGTCQIADPNFIWDGNSIVLGDSGFYGEGRLNATLGLAVAMAARTSGGADKAVFVLDPHGAAAIQINGVGDLDFDAAGDNTMLRPSPDNTIALGCSGDSVLGTFRFSSGYFATSVVTPQTVGVVISTPSAPAASTGTTYFKTIGGKVKFVALFPTGAEQVIASEP